jgi:hypothetical protein
VVLANATSTTYADINGTIRVNANGGAGAGSGDTAFCGGGGAGGSVTIEASILSGASTGSIQALGAAGGTSVSHGRHGGSGSGGRISVAAGIFTWFGNATACGGAAVGSFLPGGPGTVFFALGPNRTTRYRQLYINNCGRDTGDLSTTAARSAIVTDVVTAHTFSEIALYRRGSLAFVPPPTTVVDKLLVSTGIVSGDGTGRLRSDSRVSMVVVGRTTPYLTPAMTVSSVQLVSGVDRRLVSTTSISSTAIVVDFGDLFVASGGELVLPRNITMCGGTIRVVGRVSGVASIANCTTGANFTGLNLVYGCKNTTTASNYNPLAAVDDGSCASAGTLPGCTYAIASNFNATAASNDGSCRLPTGLVQGCLCRDAPNYNPSANLDNGSCDYSTVVKCV